MISKEKFGIVIKEFNESELPDLINRNIDIPLEIPLRRAISIIGPRRSGKTFVMYQLMRNLLDKGINKKRILYINFERTDLESAEDKDLLNLMDVLYEIYPENEKNKIWLFFDEIQNVKSWEKAVRTILDNEKIQIFISGSSSKLLSREIATSMRGRTISYKIFPFSFNEYLALNKVIVGKYLSRSEKIAVINNLRKYLEAGGYPETIIYPKEHDKILRDIIDTTIFRDIVERYNIRNVKLLKIMISSVINSASKEFSIHKFYRIIKSEGMSVSKNTIYNYLNALNDVFFVFPLRKFSYSYKRMEQSLPKIYVIDNGLLFVNGMTDKSKLIENLVFVELTRDEKDVYYYKSANGKETDFVIKKNRKIVELIQVCFSLAEHNTKDRELSGLLKASKELKCNNLLFITWDEEKEEKIDNKKIKYIPLWKWLLEKNK